MRITTCFLFFVLQKRLGNISHFCKNNGRPRDGKTYSGTATAREWAANLFWATHGYLLSMICLQSADQQSEMHRFQFENCGNGSIDDGKS
ncbi:hypothetical protein GGI35DRAFT_446487 [Trichoderma velutinum]